MSMMDAINLAVGGVGAVLGILNTWQSMTKDRVKLRVIPQHVIIPQRRAGLFETFGIEVVNLSAFAITLAEIGFELADHRRWACTEYRMSDGSHLPRRLESRESVSIILPGPVKSQPEMKQVVRAYARLQCGTVCYGTSGALRQIVDQARVGDDSA